MFKAFFLDQIIRKIVSFLYRILLCVYAIFILLNNKNIFTWYIYLIVFGIFILIYLLTIDKDNWLSKFRAFNDYFLITIILYAKPLIIPNYLFLLIPLFNAPNYSGKKRSGILYIFLFGALWILNQETFSFFYYLLPFSIIFLIDFFEKTRTRLLRFNFFLYESIDNYYVTEFRLNKSHLLYKSLIEKLNISKFKKVFTIESIICFIRRGDKLVAVNGSFFVYTYDVNFNHQEFINLKTNIAKDKKYIINECQQVQNFFLTVSAQNIDYIYVVNYGKNGPVYWLATFYLKYFLKPLFAKIADTLFIEREIMIERREYIKKIKSKLLYVNNATLAMHFLRNKFSPILGFFDTLELYDKEIIPDKKIGLFKLMQANKNKVRISIKDILKRTDLILEKSENPFLINQLSDFSLRKIFYIVRKIWNDFFDESLITFNWKNIEHNKKSFQLNEEYLEILFTDIIKNMLTYNVGGDCQLFFDENDKEYSIIFINFIRESAVEEMVKMCKIFMSEESEEIDRRKTHGLNMIKSFIKQMKISHNLKVEGNQFYFTVSFSKN